MAARTRAVHGATTSKSFIYDALNRLNSAGLVKINGAVPSTIPMLRLSYDMLGNLCTKSPLSGGTVTYQYAGPAGCAQHGSLGSPHAAIFVGGIAYGYDTDGNQTSGNGRAIAYNALNQVTQSQENGITVAFQYGPDGDRFQRTDSDTGITTYSVGKAEVRISGGSLTVRRYLGVAIDYVKSGGGNETRYTFSDHLGSMDVIASASGTLLESLSFDAHGNRRDPTTWQGSAPPPTSTNIGFTGQEHVDSQSFIHFNGRIYDPTIGRMLQADPVQNPGSQGLNRYAYVANNPLTLTDPTGYSWLSSLLHFDNNIAGRLILGPFYDSYHSDWNSFVNNPYVRMVGAIVAAYFTGGAAYSAFINAGYGTIAAGAAAGAAGGFVQGAISTGGNMEAALQGALLGGMLGELGGLNANTPRQYDFSLNGAAKAVGRQLVTNWERDQIDRFFAREFGIKGLKLDLLLTGASFAGDAIFGSRYKGEQTDASGKPFDFIDGITKREGLGYDDYTKYNLWGLPADLVDIALMSHGLPTASGWSYVFSGNHDLPLVGYSLGAGDVNTLAGYGLGSHATNYAISLPVGQVGAPTVGVTLGRWDPVNGGSFGWSTSPGATMENRGLGDHRSYCYDALSRWGLGGGCGP